VTVPAALLVVVLRPELLAFAPVYAGNGDYDSSLAG